MQRNNSGAKDPVAPAGEVDDGSSAVPPVVRQHPLSLEGRAIQPLDPTWHGGFWGLPEALAWIATRDLGIVAGVIARLKDESRPYEAQAKAALDLLDAAPHHQPDDLYGMKVDELLSLALLNDGLQGYGERVGNPEASKLKIPHHFWLDGEFSYSERGSWWAINPQLQLEWSALSFERGELIWLFPPVRFEYQPPRQGGYWIEVFEALTWETYGHAFTMQEFREKISAGLGLSFEHHLICIEMTWARWNCHFEPLHNPLKGRLVIDGKAGPLQTFDGVLLSSLQSSWKNTWLAWVLDEQGLPVDLRFVPTTVGIAAGWPREVIEVRGLLFLRERLRLQIDWVWQPWTSSIGDAAPGSEKRSAPDPAGAKRWLQLVFETHEPGWKSRIQLQEIAMRKFGISGAEFKRLWGELTKKPEFEPFAKGGRPRKRSA